MKKLLLMLCLCLASIQGFTQQKGTIEYLEVKPGIHPIMLNDSVTKHLKVLTPIGDIKNGGGYARLDEDYCVLETANLEDVLTTFKDYKINNILFYVSRTFKQECFEQLKKMYGEPTLKNGTYWWQSKQYALSFEFNPKDAKMPGQAIGLFMRKQDLE